MVQGRRLHLRFKTRVEGFESHALRICRREWTSHRTQRHFLSVTEALLRSNRRCLRGLRSSSLPLSSLSIAKVSMGRRNGQRVFESFYTTPKRIKLIDQIPSLKFNL